MLAVFLLLPVSLLYSKILSFLLSCLNCVGSTAQIAPNFKSSLVCTNSSLFLQMNWVSFIWWWWWWWRRLWWEMLLLITVLSEIACNVLYVEKAVTLSLVPDMLTSSFCVLYVNVICNIYFYQWPLYKALTNSASKPEHY